MFHNDVEVAVFQANQAIRTGSSQLQNRFCDTIEGSEYPNLLLAYVSRRLGRRRALAVGIDRPTIEKALRMFREGELV